MIQRTNLDAVTIPDRIHLHAISKRYGAVTVLDNVSFTIKSGHVHGLLGANGAGKSTLCKILSGLAKPTAGKIFLDDRPVDLKGKKNAESLGIEIVQQELNLIPTLTVAENLFLNKLPNWFGVVSKGRLHRLAESLLAKIGLDQLPVDTPVHQLGIGQQQLLEIAKSLRSVSKLLILDEPTASLSKREVATLFEQIAGLKKRGTSFLYVSHRLDEITLICDRVTILRDGKHVFTGETRNLNTDEMIAWMSGDADVMPNKIEPRARTNSGTSNIPITEKPPKRRVALWVENLCSGPVRNVSLRVFRGEILGITGLVGAGRTELLRGIFGADRASSGTIYLNDGSGTPCFRSPAQAVAAGLSMVTEDRKSTGLLLSHSLVDNACLASWKERFSRWGLVHLKRARLAVAKTCDELGTKYDDLDQPAFTLSGGNQQKIVLAKWLLKGATTYLLDEPTRGIDVGSRKIVYEVIRTLADQGAAVLFVSSDMEELISECHRIVVMSNGRITAEFDQGDFDRQQIMSASFLGHAL